MRIAAGQTAPDFTATVHGSKPLLTLSALSGRKVWLAFFRYAGCLLCNLRLHQMIERYRDWSAKGLEIVAVFQAPVEQVAHYVGKQKAPFRVVCDCDPLKSTH